MKKKYKARAGAPFSNTEAQIIGETIESLKDSRGHIPSRKVLEEAKNKSSLLHNYFEWDKSKAAEQFNLQQAKNLVNHIVEVVIVASKPEEQRSFVSVVVEDIGHVYMVREEALAIPDYRKQLLAKAVQTAKNLAITLQALQEYN